MIRVALADDHQVVREGVKRIVAAQPDLWVAAEADDGAQLLAALEREPCDVVVLDLAMPGLHGRALVERLRADHPELAIVIFSMYPEDPLALHYLRSGVHAFVGKNRPPGDLLDAIRLAARDRRFAPPSREAQAVRERQADVGEALSVPQRYGIMFLLLQGFDSAAIARDMQLPVETVDDFVRGVRGGGVDAPLVDLLGAAPQIEAPAPEPPAPETRLIRLGPVTVDLDTGRVGHPDGARDLTDIECKLLRHMSAHAGRIVSRETLLTEVWGYSAEARTRTVAMAISRVRRKIELTSRQPRYLTTALGEGYRFRFDIEPPRE